LKDEKITRSSATA